MNWSEEKAHVVESSRESDCGSCCLFIPLSETEGVKFYHSAYIRDASAKSQARAYALGLAPKVGEFCEMPVFSLCDWPNSWPNDTSKAYGYVTQIAELRELEPEEFDYLQSSMIEHGFCVADIDSRFNVGVIDGMPVCIDFDPINSFY